MAWGIIIDSCFKKITIATRIEGELDSEARFTSVAATGLLSHKNSTVKVI